MITLLNDENSRNYCRNYINEDRNYVTIFMSNLITIQHCSTLVAN